MTQATRGVLRGKLVGVKTGISDWSKFVYARLPTRPSGPAGVTATATGATESIIVTWTAPTTNADGTALKPGALKGFYVYYSKNSGIDITNPSTYDDKDFEASERYVYTVPDPSTYLGPYYFVVTAVDTEGNQSTASTEVSATASSQTPGPSSVDDWSTGNIESVLVGKGRIFIKLRLPKTTWKRSAYYKIYYDVDNGGGWSGAWTYLSSERVGYPHAPLDETYKYKYKVTVVGEDGTETTGTISDNSGAGYQPNADDQGTILGDTVAAGYVIAAYDMIARTFIGGALQSTNWGTSAGSQFDLDNETIKLGGSSSPKFSWEGTTAALSIEGSVTITAGEGRINIANPGFELGDKGWPTKGGDWQIVADSSNSHAGDYCAKAVVSSESSAAIRNGYQFDAYPGQKFWVSGWVKTDSAATGTVGVRICWLDTTGAEISTSHADVACPQTAYTQVESQVTAPASTVEGRVEGAYYSATGTLYLDDVEVREVVSTSHIEDLAITNAKISDLSADKINAGTLSADYIYGGTLDFGNISRNGLSIIQSELAANSVGHTQIDSNAVHADNLYIDDDINFAGDSTFHSITNINGIFFNSSSYPYIQHTSSGLLMKAASGYYLHFENYAGDGYFEVQDDGDLVTVFNNDTVLYKDVATSGGEWGYGYIHVWVNGVERVIELGVP